jgi:hypothetical protein
MDPVEDAKNPSCDVPHVDDAVVGEEGDMIAGLEEKGGVSAQLVEAAALIDARVVGFLDNRADIWGHVAVQLGPTTAVP